MVGGWEIRVDRTLDNGCFIFGSFEAGSILRVGFDPAAETGYVILGNDDWTSIELGKDYELVLQFDEEVPWEATASGIFMGHPFLYMPFTDFDFLDELGRKHRLSVAYEGEEIARLRLQDSYAAILEMVTCQAALLEDGKQKRAERDDPFSGGRPARHSDPFR
jgi:hypothetical protein